MAFALQDAGGSQAQTPLTYAGAGVTPGPVIGPGGGGMIGGAGVAPPVFNPGPSLPHIQGATVTSFAPQPNPFPSAPAPAPQSAPVAPQPPAQTLAGLVNTFPGVTNALALEQEGLGQLDAALKAARERAIINFGDPTLASMAGFGLDPQAGAFAQQNYLSGNSTLARLDKAHQLASQAVINQLASHGILNSGDLGYREGVENQSYGNQVYDAQQTVLQQLADLYNNYLNSRYGLENNANQAQLQALQDYLSNPDAYATMLDGGGTGGGGTTTQPPGTIHLGGPMGPDLLPKPKQAKIIDRGPTQAALTYGPRGYVYGGASKAVAKAIKSTAARG